VNSHSSASPASKEILPGEVFINTADFDSGIRRLLPKYDEMLDVLVVQTTVFWNWVAVRGNLV
jgi:tRNA (cmo5U34)-methyltransferase